MTTTMPRNTRLSADETFMQAGPIDRRTFYVSPSRRSPGSGSSEVVTVLESHTEQNNSPVPGSANGNATPAQGGWIVRNDPYQGGRRLGDTRRSSTMTYSSPPVIGNGLNDMRDPADPSEEQHRNPLGGCTCILRCLGLGLFRRGEP